ncbi:MAG: DNA polymerase III subunit gamma/tau [Ponticaulis sp.]|nr:DNA polymerase III subunit gamma/tau [Ponticaulis sp.]|tara:strand:- start:9085 stop:10848 length:1764 start_codon:yes stop_codon:yes gene_type:complete
MSESELPEEEEEERDDKTFSMFGGEDAPAPQATADKKTGYLVLARKYRPQSFDELIGQESMVKTLENAFRTNRVAHAFMLTGVRGIGKTTTARLLARALNYETDTVGAPSLTMEPPGRHCEAIQKSQHPDVLELDAASRTGVDDMRELLDGARYTPVSARYKVFIIDEVHMLSKSAFNALLKTLEEPPEHVKFIFATTEIRKVPVTVLSRCQRFDLRRLDIETLAQHLTNICAKEGLKVAPEGLTLIARAAEGSVRDALSILDQALVSGEPGAEIPVETIRDMLGLADHSRLIALFDLCVSGDHKQVLAELESQFQAGADPQTILKDMIELAVEVGRASVLGEDYSASGPAEWTRLTKEIAAKITPAQSTRLWQILMKGLETIQIAPNPVTSLEMTLIQMTAAAHVPPPEEAIKAIIEASQGGTSPGKPEAPAAPAAGAAITPTNQPSDFKGILNLLESRKRADIQYDVEKFVRPGEVRFGYISFLLEDGATPGLISQLQKFLEVETGSYWEVDQIHSEEETVRERVQRERKERIAEAMEDPYLSELLTYFPGAEVVDVTPEPKHESDENIVHVDFAAQQTPRKESR